MQNERRLIRLSSVFAIALFFGLSARFSASDLPNQLAQGTPPGIIAIAIPKLIEVHGPEIVYVPTTTKCVTYDGIVRQVVKFSETLEEGEDCPCPRCCDGRCYVIIYTDPITPGGPLRIPYILWLAC